MRTSITRRRVRAIESLKNKWQVLGGYSDALIFKMKFDCAIALFQSDSDGRTIAGIFDRVIQKNQKKLPHECFIAHVRYVRHKFSNQNNILCIRTRFDQRA